MFQNFNSRREEGDGVIAGALVTGFTRFLDWCCNGVFPDGGVIVVIECEVVKVGEVLWSQWVKVFELIYGKAGQFIQGPFAHGQSAQKMEK